MRRCIWIVSLWACSGSLLAQGAGEPARGSTPPGMSQDGSRPAEGAITGGTAIKPGEKAGMPDNDAATTAPADEKLRRCYELSGSLREECLRKETSAGTGETSPGRIEVPPGMRGGR